MNRSDFIPFAYFDESLPFMFVKHKFGFIKIHSNRLDLLRLAVFPECMCTNARQNRITGIVVVKIEHELFKARVTRKQFDSEKYTPKTSKMYIPNMVNTSMRVQGTEVQTTYYPFPKLSFFDSGKHFFYAAVFDEIDCIKSLAT